MFCRKPSATDSRSEEGKKAYNNQNALRMISSDATDGKSQMHFLAEPVSREVSNQSPFLVPLQTRSWTSWMQLHRLLISHAVVLFCIHIQIYNKYIYNLSENKASFTVGAPVDAAHFLLHTLIRQHNIQPRNHSAAVCVWFMKLVFFQI